MSILSEIRSLFVPPLRMAVVAEPASASRAALDGRSFDGIVLECEITFKDGRFRSTACDQYGYGDGPYSATPSGETVVFEAETESPKYGKLLWNGVVRGPRLDGTMTMVRDGRPAGEKWILAGERN